MMHVYDDFSDKEPKDRIRTASRNLQEQYVASFDTLLMLTEKKLSREIYESVKGHMDNTFTNYNQIVVNHDHNKCSRTAAYHP